MSGLRQMGVNSAARRSPPSPSATAARTSATSAAACASRPNVSPSPAIIVSASSTLFGSVRSTFRPAARSASTSSRRFSSRFAMTRSGAMAVIAATSGFFVPPTTGTRSISPAGSSQ